MASALTTSQESGKLSSRSAEPPLGPSSARVKDQYSRGQVPMSIPAFFPPSVASIPSLSTTEPYSTHIRRLTDVTNRSGSESKLQVAILH
ncbi:hypothetical protein RvY_11613 [Ramazzottius varieornatus]|uniref:Uncharacterized protein n=1 Tax=Ramazzottius varieornatus TaxID=947166 RepID=A0A1D1VGN6_RAMVA|nr:hypothetical protein RvY_11613 [Ramazzottius varieornatus]